MTTLSNLKKIEVIDILQDLPDIIPLNISRDMAGNKDDLFLTALGFEDRCLWIPEILSEENKYKAKNSVYFEFDTNQSDNELNKPRLLKAVKSFTNKVRPMSCDSDDFVSDLRELFSTICTKKKSPKVTFDISSCSSKLLITTLTVLLDFNIQLRIVYSEANVYHPTKAEYNADPVKWTSDDEMGLARGVSTVIRSPEHPGRRRDALPEAVIVFPTFKPERVRAILTDIDPSLLLRPDKRVVWLVGSPHLKEVDGWRADAQMEINGITSEAPSYRVCTFDYKKTLEIMERVYQPFDCKFLVNIAPLGSKMQSLGIAFYWYIRQEASIYFASPREYNATQYSEGCKAMWQIDFGLLDNIRKCLDSVGELQVLK